MNDVAVSGPLGAETPRYDTVIDSKAIQTGTVVDPLTGTLSELRESKTGRFVKGHAPLAGAGRPKKGESLIAYTQKLVEGRKNNLQAVAEAKLDRLLDRGSVGNRAWAEYRDTYHGKPGDTLHITTGEAPADALDARIAAYLSAGASDNADG